jgi:hypothetical protein
MIPVIDNISMRTNSGILGILGIPLQDITNNPIEEYPIIALPGKTTKNDILLNLFGKMFRKLVLFSNGNMDNIINESNSDINDIVNGNVCIDLPTDVWNIVLEYNGNSNMRGLMLNIYIQIGLDKVPYSIFSHDDRKTYGKIGINSILDGTTQNRDSYNVQKIFNMMYIIIQKLSYNEQMILRFIMRQLPYRIVHMLGINPNIESQQIEISEIWEDLKLIKKKESQHIRKKRKGDTLSSSKRKRIKRNSN